MSKANQKYAIHEIQDYIYAIRCSLVNVFGELDAAANCAIEPEFFIDRVTNNKHLLISQKPFR